MQIYKDMNIGTAKVSREEMENIKHYMIDFLSPEERYNVSEYKISAEKDIEEVLKNGKVPIVTGGTGLYINSLIYGIEFQKEEFDEKYREKLNDIAENEGLEKLYEEAVKIDWEAMQKISKNDKKRIIRVLEIYHKTGKTKTEQERESRANGVKYKYYVFGIDVKREILYGKINDRVDKMIDEGLINEVENILKKYKKFPTAMQGLGYKEVVEYLNKQITKEEMIDKIKTETRHYAKRQLTWFRKNKEIIWLNGENSIADNVKNITEKVFN